MWKPKQRDALVAVVVGIDQKYDIGFPQLFPQVVPLLGHGRRVDDDCSGIFGGSYRRREGDLREAGLDFIGDEGVFDQRGDDTGLSRALISANTYSHCRGHLLAWDLGVYWDVLAEGNYCTCRHVSRMLLAPEHLHACM